MENLKQENNYKKFKQDVQMWIDDTQYWINSYSLKASFFNKGNCIALARTENNALELNTKCL